MGACDRFRRGHTGGKSIHGLNRDDPAGSHSQGCLDEAHGVSHLLVLPHPDNRPTGLDQQLFRLPIPFDVATKFGRPPCSVRLGPCGMQRAAVPEAAVHVDGNTASRECDVDGPAAASWYRPGDSVAMPSSVEGASEGELRRRPLPELSPHPIGRSGTAHHRQTRGRCAVTRRQSAHRHRCHHHGANRAARRASVKHRGPTMSD